MHPIAHAQARPDHPAIIMAGSGETVSYRQLDEIANRFVHLLRSRGIGAGGHFGLLMENNALYLQLVWGSQRSGAMMVPISTRLTAPEIAYILRDCDAKLLVTSTLADQPDVPLLDPVPGQYMLYSSGTTGRPKGVRPRAPDSDDIQAAVPLVGLAVMGAGMPADGSMVYLSPAPLYHAAPLGWCTTAHRLGGTVVVMEKFDPETALQAIERYGVTDSQWVPTHFVRMLKLDPSQREGYDLSSHQRALHAAAPCPVPVKQAMIEWWGPVVNEYYAGSEGIGMTMVKAQEWLERPGTVGKAIFGTLHICGSDGAELPPGEDGLIYFENAVLPTYHNDPAKTAEAMHPKGWMTLGDIGHVDAEGYLYLTDRKSHMIITGGVNVYPQEVENLLVSHPKVMDAAVIGAPDPDLGEKVVAVVQPLDMGQAGEALEAELRAYLEPELSRIKMPRLFEFRSELPREANGKLYKRELRDEFAARIEADG